MKTMILAALLVALLAPMARAAGEMPVTPQERAAVSKAIHALYDAYTKRDLKRVLAIEKDAIDLLATEYEKKHGPGQGDVYRKAFSEDTADIIHNKDFHMQPMHLEDVQYRRSPAGIEVTGVVPILATAWVKVGSGEDTHTVRLRFGRFVFARTGDGSSFRIVRMDLY